MDEASRIGGTFLNSLLDNQKPSQAPKGRRNSNKKTPVNSKPTKSISSYFQEQTSTPNNLDESISSTMSFDSVTVLNAEIPEIPEMTSVLKFEIVADVEKYVEDSDKILQQQNELIRRHNENSSVIQSSSRSINNLSSGIGNLTDKHNDLKVRVQSLEISKECAFDSLFVNIILVDGKEADEIENGIIGHNVRASDRGILVSYKTADKHDESKTVFRTSVLTCEKDVDELRKQLKVEDAYISVNDKYNSEYWKSKNKPETTQKRGRECDDTDLIIEPKRLSSDIQNQN